MNTRLNWIDRIRIERAVWALDTYVQSLPGRSRRAIRRELRVNLGAAAAEVGVAEAIRRLGGLRRLAIGYLENEYGEDRPRWLRGIATMIVVELALLAAAYTMNAGFLAGIEAANPRPDGTYAWDDLGGLGITGDATYDDGSLATFGVAFSAWTLLYLVAALILGGRLWRLPGAWWRARRRVFAPTT